MMSRRSQLFLIVAHLIAWLGYLGTALYVCPGIIRKLADLNANLPLLAVFVIRISNWTIAYRRLCLLAIFAIVVIDVALYALVKKPSALKTGWFVIVLLPPLLFLAAAIVGFGVPLYLNSQ